MRVFVNNSNRPIPYCISFLLTLAGYCAYFASIIIFLCLIVPCIAVLSVNRRLQNRIARKTLRSYLILLTQKLLPALQVYSIAEISGFPGHADSPAIYVANHRGKLDALLLLSILSDAGVLIKSKYARFPLYRALVKYIDFVSVDSDTPQSLSGAMDRCRGILSAGNNILVFPEGTRATSGRLLPFKEFAFWLAAQTGFPLIPVIVHSDYPFMAKLPGSIFPKNKLHYTVRCLEPHYPIDKEKPASFAARLHARMAEELKMLDRGTVWERTRDDTCPTA
jgi:1-acyl-sn-glycerol-3-phosphate acyltransferase